MVDTVDFWRGGFGDEYTKRNRVDWIKRIPFWRDIMARTGARSVLEVGCNMAWNLSALRLIMAGKTRLSGVEINELAAEGAENLGFWIVRTVEAAYGNDVSRRLSAKKRRLWKMNRDDLVFTAGVLIHIAPQDLKKFMQDIVAASAQYVLAVEYFAEKEEEIEYRGQAGKLWKRNYGKLYEDMGLKCIDTGFLDKEAGFDNCTYWLMGK